MEEKMKNLENDYKVVFMMKEKIEEVSKVLGTSVLEDEEKEKVYERFLEDIKMMDAHIKEW